MDVIDTALTVIERGTAQFISPHCGKWVRNEVKQLSAIISKEVPEALSCEM